MARRLPTGRSLVLWLLAALLAAGLTVWESQRRDAAPAPAPAPAPGGVLDIEVVP